MADANAPSGPAYELVLPFVAVHSVGGPYDDLAYAAGWEMGALNVELRHVHPPSAVVMVRAANGAQAELIAMRHGYVAHQVPYDDHWTKVTLRLAPADQLDEVTDRRPQHGRRRRRTGLD